MVANAVLAWVVIGGGLLAMVFWLARQLLLWYWRVDEALALMERQAKAAERTAGAVEELLERAKPGRE